MEFYTKWADRTFQVRGLRLGWPSARWLKGGQTVARVLGLSEACGDERHEMKGCRIPHHNHSSAGSSPGTRYKCRSLDSQCTLFFFLAPMAKRPFVSGCNVPERRSGLQRETNSL